MREEDDKYIHVISALAVRERNRSNKGGSHVLNTHTGKLVCGKNAEGCEATGRSVWDASCGLCQKWLIKSLGL